MGWTTSVVGSDSTYKLCNGCGAHNPRPQRPSVSQNDEYPAKRQMYPRIETVIGNQATTRSAAASVVAPQGTTPKHSHANVHRIGTGPRSPSARNRSCLMLSKCNRKPIKPACPPATFRQCCCESASCAHQRDERCRTLQAKAAAAQSLQSSLFLVQPSCRLFASVSSVSLSVRVDPRRYYWVCVG